jgi:hypothetical protein
MSVRQERIERAQDHLATVAHGLTAVIGSAATADVFAGVPLAILRDCRSSR